MDAVAELVAVRWRVAQGRARHRPQHGPVELEWGRRDGADAPHQGAARPDGLLNPGVIINDDPKAHLTYPSPCRRAMLSWTCIECGFCEAVCPSRTCRLAAPSASCFTANWPAAIVPMSLNQLARLFDYQGIDTCAATGLCADRCRSASIPVRSSRSCALTNTGASCPSPAGRRSLRLASPARLAEPLGLKGLPASCWGQALAGLVNGVRHLSGQRTPAWLPTPGRAAAGGRKGRGQ